MQWEVSPTYTYQRRQDPRHQVLSPTFHLLIYVVVFADVGLA